MTRTILRCVVGIGLALPAFASSPQDAPAPQSTMERAASRPVNPVHGRRTLNLQHRGDTGTAPDVVGAFERYPDTPQTLFLQGVAAYGAGDFGAAVSDLEAARSEAPDDLHRIAWVYLARLNHGGDARAVLSDHTTGLDLHAWPGPLLAWYLDRGTLRQVVDKARDADLDRQVVKTCEAGFFVGQKLLSDGLLEDARPWFATAVATCEPSAVLHAQARALLDAWPDAGDAAVAVAGARRQDSGTSDARTPRGSQTSTVAARDVTPVAPTATKVESAASDSASAIATGVAAVRDHAPIASLEPVPAATGEVLTPDTGLAEVITVTAVQAPRVTPVGPSEVDVVHVSADASGAMAAGVSVVRGRVPGSPMNAEPPASEQFLTPVDRPPVTVATHGPLPSDQAPASTPAMEIAALNDSMVGDATGRPEVDRDVGDDEVAAVDDALDATQGQLFVATGAVNLRSGPSLRHEKVGILESGSEVSVEASVGAWKRVRLPGGDEAFVHGDFLRATGTGMAADSLRRVDGRRHVATARANLRAGPGTEHASVGVVEEGTYLFVHGETGNWWRVRTETGRDAFVYKPLSRPDTPNESGAAARAALTLRAGPASGGSPPGEDGAPRNAAPSEHDAEDFLTTSVVNVRAGPGTIHAPLQVLQAAHRVTADAVTQGWYRIPLADGSHGFIHGDFLEPAGDSPSADGVENLLPRRYRTTTRVNYRAGPGTRYARVGVAQTGDVVIVDGEAGSWFRVRTTDERVVFLHKDFLEPSSEVVSAPALSVATTRRHPATTDTGNLQ